MANDRTGMTGGDRPTVSGRSRPDSDESSEELLARFDSTKDAEVFGALVARHGPMVREVCRRVLRNDADADDAFQAVFLILARDSAGVFDRKFVVSAWLYGTACRVCKQAIRTRSRRATHEAKRSEQMANSPPPDPATEPLGREAEAVIDEELGRLPERYREPLVLCHVAGLTQDQAALQLGLNPRTIQRRMQAGLLSLRDRLTRRGYVLSVAAIAATIAVPTAAVAVPPGLSESTTLAAIRFADGTPAAANPAVIALAATPAKSASWGMWSAVGGVLATGLALGGIAAFGPDAIGPGDGPGVAKAPTAAAKAEAAPQTRWFSARGRVVDLQNRPVADVTVVFLSRPIRRNPDGTIEPIADPLATRMYKTGKFRELATAVSAPDGTYTLTANLQTPDPTTNAIWFQSLPVIRKVDDRPLRIVESEGEFGNMIWLPGVGVP